MAVSYGMQPPAELAAMLRPPDNFDARPPVEYLAGLVGSAGASDLHLRPGPSGVEVLLRCDGVLRLAFVLPSEIYERLLVGLKNMARLASYRRSTPQDGRLKAGSLELRVATAPTHFGEKVVLRRVGVQELWELSDLGFTGPELERLWRMSDQPQGLVLATGPAGSGKSTTLLALMRSLVRRQVARLGPGAGSRVNVVTLEDPIEAVVPEFCQTEMQPEIGMTFASGLRSLLRQDPEMILVGEIRDAETAGAVLQTSLTGHLVFSTLHTRDTLGAIPRLLEMGAEPYQLAASLSGVVYQRLVRRLCACRREVEAGPEVAHERRVWGLAEGPVWEPQGCSSCSETGYSGRLAVGEMLEVDEGLRTGVLERLGLDALRERARAAGWVGLRQAALERVGRGETSYAEVCRVVPLR